jgi:hypothetical protein
MFEAKFLPFLAYAAFWDTEMNWLRNRYSERRRTERSLV